MGFTENGSATFLSTGNPCLDFFFHVVPNMPPQDLIGRVDVAWAHNPLTTLKLICNLRGVRGTGKSDKEGFYLAALWLHYNHPKTLSGNLKALSEFGYFKDFLEILYRILEGPYVRKFEKEQRENSSRSRRRYGRGHRRFFFPKARAEKEKARVLRKQRELNKAVKGLQTYITDEKYRLLHDKISYLFAEMLEADIKKLNSEKLGDISLAAKWCPTIDSSYDKTTLICESIARKLFPKDKYTEYEGLKEAHYVYKVRDRLRKQVLVPLHKALELPEVYMSAKQWNMLPYKRVASVAMKNYTKKFAKHDNERFREYLRKVKTGEAKIAAGALLPHEIIRSLQRADPEEAEVAEVAELQWKRIVDDLAKKGKLSNCIAICDVSGSMFGIPMEVCVALGILVSELSEEPWKGSVITFSANPQLHKVEGETLLKKIAFVGTMECGMNTNFQKPFDRILEIAVEGNLSQEQMIRRVFVFSDMEFDQVSENSWETDYEVIQRKFREKGFTNVPEVVFWNLRASQSTPVVGNQSGVALVSGFSKNLLTIFLENGGIVNPEEVMELAISGEEYKKLAVLD
nr:uncharacterized protein LOC113734273 [Ipomoea batatas]